MTVADLIAIANNLVKSQSEEMVELGMGIIDLLAEADPCGFDLVQVIKGDEDGPWIQADWLVSEVSPTDARHMARMLLRAADEAEK